MLPINRPTCVLFLDIDGVIAGHPDDLPRDNLLCKSVELFGDKASYSALESQQMLSYFFDEGALNHVRSLIGKIERVASLTIVISSEWRKKRTLEDLKDKIFDRTGFADRIIGKTSEKARTRGGQIAIWLSEQNPRPDSFVILDDNEFDLNDLFPDQFVHIDSDELMTAERTEEAFLRVMDQLSREALTRSPAS